MTDYVKKDDIFEYVCMDCKSLALDCKGANRTPCEKVKAFRRILSANVIEPKRGEWINKNRHTRYCSVCGFEETEWYTKDYNFCPNCGADMRKKTIDYKSIILTCDSEGNWSMHGERKESE